MADTLNFDIFIDTVSLIDRYPPGSYNSPSNIPNHFVSINTKTIGTPQFQAANNLNLANNCMVRVRTISLYSRTNPTSVIYDLVCSPNPGVVSPTLAYESQPYVPLPILIDKTNTQPPTFQSNAIGTDYFLEFNAIGRGDTSCTVKFYVTKPGANGKPAMYGYYSWNMTIMVN